MVIKLGREVTCDGGTPTSKSCDLLTMWSRDKWKKYYIWASSIPTAIKLERVILTVWRSHTLSYMTLWSHGQVKNIKPYICTSAVLMTTKLDRVVTCSGGKQLSKSRDFVITCSRDKWKKLHLHLHNTYGHQAWESSSFHWRNPTH